MLNNIKSAFNDLPRVARFVAMGGFTTVTSFAVYSALILLGVHFTLASLVSLISGIVIGYSLNKNVVFYGADNVFMKYIMLWAMLYFVNILIIFLITNNTNLINLF